MAKCEKSNEQLINGFLNYLQNQRNFSVNTVKSYSIDLKQLCNFTNNKDLTELDKDDIEAFINILRLRKLNITTVNRKISCIKSFVKWLNKQNVKVNNTLKDIELLKDTRNKIPVVCEFDKIKTRIDTISNIRDRLILKFLLYTGLRVGELVNIKISNINSNKKTIIIRGKGNKMRLAIIHPNLENDLRLYIEQFKPQIYLFESRITGQNITVRAIEKLVKKYFPDLHPHIFRHTFATYYLEKGGNIRNVQELLGHSSLRTTQIYLNVNIEKVKQEYCSIFP